VKEKLMLALRLLSHFVVLFVAAAGFLFGQLFNGHFSVVATAAGLGGLGAGILGLFTNSSAIRKIVVGSATVGVLGALFHVYDYYSSSSLQGSYYPWFLTGPYLICLLIVVWPSVRAAREPSVSVQPRPAG
jgi:hypothetical protein